MTHSLYSISVTNIENKEVPLSAYQGKVLLIVNVASQCGFTPQYEGLEKLQKKLGDQGFAVLGFPCNQFGKQEPGDSEEIKNFCKLTYDVSFPLFKKIEVNGANTHPLYQLLKAEKPGLLGTQAIKWNFTKFLVDKNGQVVERFAPTDKPESFEAKIEQLLK
jgi:glutathione peroxidase